ncbi:preprotein translocase subunit SCY2, chloroplastic isoform X2 [Sesamum indicum]|uniref:Preprotein translocase subunit SCY2, chloroplastic isoform X2 n=1 Tax=Sesamum indicum TaxID=4182 RepID=A0A8M8V2J5_SESIN|nr:preprotein translocase subunit SCY2, chloroplastic isoform X2 [Sesamum indicum]
MEAALLKPQPHFYTQSRTSWRNSQLHNSGFSRTHISLKTASSELSRRRFCLSRKHEFLNENGGCLSFNCFRRDVVTVRAASTESINYEQFIDTSGSGERVENVNSFETSAILERKPEAFRNRFLNFVQLGSIINNAAESFFKSEIRRRLFVTAVLIVVSRLGYFIPLPGFDRRLMPENYLSFVSGSVDELGDLTPELKLSLFQLGISPQIAASILMQVLCHVVPSLVKLRKEGLDGHEKIKSYIWWISLGFAVIEALVLSFYSLPYSIYAASHRAKHVMLTTLYLVCGAMTMTWICDKISESGFGQGSSLIICVSILTGYTDTLYKMLTQLSGSSVSWWPYVLAVLGVFTIVTMWAVVVTEGCRKIKLQYYGFKLASATRFSSYGGGALYSIQHKSFWNATCSHHIISLGISRHCCRANMPKEIADYLNKMGARIPNIKPGKATIEYLTKIQASTRFWGGVLLSFLATTSTILDHYLRRINEGFSIGFTSILIIVGSIIELRRSYQAYNVMPSLSKALRRYGL